MSAEPIREIDSTALDRARALAADIAQAGDAIEAGRALTDDLLAALHRARLFRLTLPRWLSGEELSPPELAQVTECVAAADASTAWCLGQAFGCGMSAAFMHRDAAAEVFGPDHAVLAWGAGAQGQAVPVSGGYRVTGEWKFASGSYHATWIGAHCKVVDEHGAAVLGKSGKPQLTTALFRREQVAMLDDWHVMGLRGTRSEGYRIDGLFVDEVLTLDRETLESRQYDAPLYRFPTTNVYAGSFSGVALGVARGALDDLRALATHKTARGARSSLRDSPVFQTELAELEAQHASARAFQRNTLLEVWDGVEVGEPLSIDQRAQIRLATTWAIRKSAEVVYAVHRMAGSSAIFSALPFERRFRDMHAVSQQVQGRATNFENVGRYLLGHQADTLFM
ncbi:MAG: acyl-CoA dehydrogenase family protein [Pseudomonadota bacterium]